MGDNVDGGNHRNLSPLGGGSNNGVTAFWFLLVGLAGSVVFIGVALAVATERGSLRKAHWAHASSQWVALAIFVLGIGCLGMARLFGRRLDASSDASLLSSYRRRFFVWVGLGEIPLFTSVAAVAVTGRYWHYLIGAAFAGVGFIRVAPTGGHVSRDQDQLLRNGHSRSLVAALATMPALSPRGR
jgi:hypothetical protein